MQNTTPRTSPNPTKPLKINQRLSQKLKVRPTADSAISISLGNSRLSIDVNQGGFSILGIVEEQIELATYHSVANMRKVCF